MGFNIEHPVASDSIHLLPEHLLCAGGGTTIILVPVEPSVAQNTIYELRQHC